MNWPAIQEAIRLAVVSSVGIPDAQVGWENQAGGWENFPSVDLVLRTPQGVGVDETRFTFDEESDRLVASQEGPRQFRVTVKIENESQVPGEESVGHLAGRMRTRLRRPTTLAALRAAGVALSSIEPTLDADSQADGRMISASITDVVFLAAETDTDPTASGDYIRQVKVQGTLDGQVQPEITITKP